MKKCILCGDLKEDNEFNKEHIVPKNLGGSLTIQNLCKDCNSKIGDKLDHAVAGTFLFKIYKNNEKIKSNRRNYIEPFPEFVSEEDPDRKIKISNDEEGNLKIIDTPHKPTLQVIKDENDNKRAVGILTIDPNTPIEERVDIINELGAENSVKLSSESEKNIKSGKIDSKIINHQERFCMAEIMDIWPMIKLYVRIAYEIAFYKLGKDYFNDSMREKLKNYLESDYEGIDDLYDRYGISINLINDDTEIKEVINQLSRHAYNDNNLLHFILVQPAKFNDIKAINVFINLFNKTTYNVLISENYDRYKIKDFNVVMMFKKENDKYYKEFYR